MDDLHSPELEDFQNTSTNPPHICAKKRTYTFKTPRVKKCKTCGEEDLENLEKAWDSKNQKVYVKNNCKSCKSKKNALRRTLDPKYRRKELAYSEKVKLKRRNNIESERYIYTDCKASDRKFGREFDLTREFIKEQIDKGCQFCGETTIRMTMDRIDNDIGHLKTNVVPACIRCNYVRRDMPYKAWLRMAGSMRAAREAGEFGDWTCEIMRGSRKLRKRT